MALAHLAADDANPERYEFIADLGTNAYFEYKIGSASTERELDHVELTSELRRAPSADRLQSQFRLRIPAEQFSRRSRALQLWSYRDAQRNGPACSRVLLVVPQLAGVAAPLARASALGEEGSVLNPPPFASARPREFSFQESTLSHSMFLQELLGALRTLAPALVQLLPAGAQSTLTPELITRLLQLLGGGGAPQPTAAPATPPTAAPPPASPTPAPSLSLGARAISRQQDGGLLSGPLLASLLGPILQQAPQLLQVLADRPLQFLTTILQTQLQRRQSEQDFMAGLLAEVNRSQLMRELLRASGSQLPAATPSLSLSASSSSGRRMRELAGASLQFEPGPTLSVGSKHKSVYAADGGIELRARLSVPGPAPRAPLPRALCEITITATETRRELLSKTCRLQQLAADSAFGLALEASEVQRLPAHRDLQVSACLRWPNARGELLCVRGLHALYLSRGFIVVSDAGAGEEHALRDPDEYRAFWHKLWEGPTESETADGARWQLSALCRYYVTASFERGENGRLPTRLLADHASDGEVTRQVRGRMKSGIELSLDELNKLLPRLARRDPLPADKLAALKSSELRPRFDLEATTQLELRGRRGQVGVVWAYPEVMLRELVLAEITERDGHGQVTRTRQERVLFPFPSALHFLSLRST